MFGVYVTLDNRNVLDAQKVFVSMALINILKTPLSQLPFAISTTMQVSDFSTMYICWPRESCWWGLMTDRFRLWFPWDVWESTCAQRNWKWRTSQRPHPVLVRFPTFCTNTFSAWLNNFPTLFNDTKSLKNCFLLLREVTACHIHRPSTVFRCLYLWGTARLV